MTMTVVPEIKVDSPAPAPVPSNLSFKDDDFASDIAKLRAQMTTTSEATPAEPTQPQAEKPVTTPEVAQQTAPVTEEAKPEIPEKFKTPDGTLDTAKVEKATISAEETLAKYLEKERELKRKINEVKAKENAYLNPPTTVQTPTTIPVNPNFAKQLEDDISKEGVGTVLSKLFIAAQEAAEEKVKAQISSIASNQAEMTTKAQIEAIGKNDPWVYTKEGYETLAKTLEEQPYLWQAADPYKAAYVFYQGHKSVVTRPAVQVMTPTPTARASAPVPTAQAVRQAPTPTIKLETKADIEAHLKSLTPAQQREFFKKAGFPDF